VDPGVCSLALAHSSSVSASTYRPYRAPELLFGAQSYDAFAIDLWSFGANFAEFFTPLRLCYDGDDDDDGNYDSNTSDKIKAPFIMPQTKRMYFNQARWVRDSLFNSEQGDIGLAWSIFKCRGTPTDEIWPVCHYQITNRYVLSSYIVV
jgi:serine/threonine protein kinase